MIKIQRAFSGIIIIFILMNILSFPASCKDVADDTSWEASLAYKKTVTIMKGSLYNNSAMEGLVDGVTDDLDKTYLRTNRDSIDDDRWTWFQVDLGEPKEVNFFKIYTHKLYKSSTDSCITKIRIEGSDDEQTFDEIIADKAPEKGNAFPMNTLLQFAAPSKTTAQYIRIWLKIADQVGEQFFVPSLNEFGVYNVSDTLAISQQSSSQSDNKSNSSAKSTPAKNQTSPVADNFNYTDTPKDIVGTTYQEAADTLLALKIMAQYKDGTFKPEDTMTRAEFVAITCRMLGASDFGAAKQATPFSDVPENYWASGYIKTAVDYKLISCNSDKKFGPDELITMEQASKILVCALGFDFFAGQKGGYPIGYSLVATEINLYKNVNKDAHKSLVRGTIAQMIYNALNVDIMELAYGDSYVVNNGNTLLTKRLKIQKGSGQVTGTGSTTIYGKSNLEDDEVTIGTQIYKIGDTKAKDYLGYDVVYYYKEDDRTDSNVLIYIKPGSNQNNVVEINADNIDRTNTTADRLFYWNDNENVKNSKYFNISLTPFVIYNGKVSENYNKSYLTPFAGSVKLIDSDNNGVYELVIITDYEMYVVDTINAADGYVYDKIGKPALQLDVDDRNIDITIKKAGNVAKLSDIKQWDVLAVASSKDHSVISVIVNSAQIKGKIEELSNDTAGKPENVVIDGKEYKISTFFKDSISIDDEGTFCLDIYGKIVAADINKFGKSQYGYLMDAAKKEGLSDLVQFKILTTDGKWLICDGAKKIKYGESDKIEAETVIDRLKADRLSLVNLDKDNKLHQLIRYTLNSNNEIYELKVAVDKTTSAATYEPNTFSLVAKQASGKYLNGYITRNIKISDKANVFVISPLLKEEECGVYAQSNFFVVKDYTTKDNLTVYDFDESLEARTVVIYQTKALIPNLTTAANVAIIDNISACIDSKGNNTKKFYLFEDGKRKSVIFDEFTSLTNMFLPTAYNDTNKAGADKLKKGDIIQYIEKDGVVANYRVLYRYTDDAAKTTDKVIFRGSGTSTSVAADSECVYGTYVERIGKRIVVNTNEGELFYDLGAEVVYEYNVEQDRISISSIGEATSAKQDPAKATKVFVQAKRNTVKALVIYK